MVKSIKYMISIQVGTLYFAHKKCAAVERQVCDSWIRKKRWLDHHLSRKILKYILIDRIVPFSLQNCKA